MSSFGRLPFCMQTDTLDEETHPTVKGSKTRRSIRFFILKKDEKLMKEDWSGYIWEYGTCLVLKI